MLYQPKREKGGIEGRGWEGGLEMDRKGRGETILYICMVHGGREGLGGGGELLVDAAILLFSFFFLRADLSEVSEILRKKVFK